MGKPTITQRGFIKTIFILPFLFLSFAVTVHGAQWAKTYGADGLYWAGQQWANSIQQTADGGYIVAGATTAFDAGFSQGWVLKLDADGVVQWEKQYGLGDGEEINCIRQTSDGGYIAAGRNYPMTYPQVKYQAWVFKLHENGTTDWSWTFGGGENDVANSVQETSDGGFIVAGSSASFHTQGGKDMWVFKLSGTDGTLIWQHTFGGAGDDEANSVQQTSDGGYIVAGSTSSFGNLYPYAWVFKLDENGALEWQKRYGHGDGTAANSIQQTSDGGFIVAGNSYLFVLPQRWYDAWVFKIDENGVFVWGKDFGGSDNDYANSIQQTSDGGYIVAGQTESSGAGDSNLWVLKIDSDGNIPGCEIASTLPGTGVDTTANGISTSAATGEGILHFPLSNLLTGINTDATIGVQCFIICTYSILPTSRAHGSGAETGTVNVTATAGCEWTATSNAAWVTITSGISGTGNGTVGYSVSANPSNSPRIGTMTIAGETFTVTQEAGVCTYSILPTSRSHGSGAETGSVDVTTLIGCTWMATSNAAWITITSGSNGTGNGTVSYSVSANPSSIPRSGTLTIAGKTFTVNQDGVACTYSILPTSRSHGPGAETGTVDVTSPEGCSWTATSNAAWITITSGSAGSGNGTAGYSVSANASPTSRTGTLTVAGQTFTVTQDGSVYPIVLTSPADQTSFDACSFYSLPTFAWNPTGSFKSYQIEFSSSDTFDSIPVKVKTSKTEIVIPSSTWKKILSIPGGQVFWRVVGTRTNKTQATSNVCLLLVGAAQEVENPEISPTAKASLPTLSWTNRCNIKFKVWFGNDSQFSKRKSFSFNLKNPSGTFSKALTSSQWSSIRKLVGDVSGSTVYWYVESWDGLNRRSQTDVMSFVLAD